VDLALAAALAENALVIADLPSGVPVAPEVLVPRLGEYLIGKGLLNQESLQQALAYQREQSRQGHPTLVGQALIELGLIDRELLDQAITEQILELQAALQQANRRLEQRVRERTAELQHALTKLTELNQLKSNFISNISHELRTPLTHIKGYVELMADFGLGPITEDQSEALKVMHRASGKLEKLINDLLRFSMASRGEFTLRMAPISLEPIIQNAISQSQGKAHSRRVSLELDQAPGLPTFKGDDEKMTWVLVQLLDNAIKFTEPGGRVRLSAHRVDSGIQVAVSDTGIGIPPEKMDEIFEPFHQLDGTSTRRHEGTGLGLALVQRIVEAHGALIRAHSQVGIGSRFEFTLQTSQSEPRQA
jgi:signal transduction histidine kinase